MSSFSLSPAESGEGLDESAGGTLGFVAIPGLLLSELTLNRGQRRAVNYEYVRYLRHRLVRLFDIHDVLCLGLPESNLRGWSVIQQVISMDYFCWLVPFYGSA